MTDTRFFRKEPNHRNGFSEMAMQHVQAMGFNLIQETSWLVRMMRYARLPCMLFCGQDKDHLLCFQNKLLEGLLVGFPMLPLPACRLPQGFLQTCTQPNTLHTPLMEELPIGMRGYAE